MGPQVAVTAGASSVARMDVTIGHVSSNRFPPALKLPIHSHPEATVAVILRGGFAGSYRGGERDVHALSLIVEPAGEPHANYFGSIETAILTLSLSPGLGEILYAAVHLFSHRRDPFAELIARRAATELAQPDDVTPLAVEAAALELMARITRISRTERPSAVASRTPIRTTAPPSRVSTRICRSWCS
jgi:hypothetical protein